MAAKQKPVAKKVETVKKVKAPIATGVRESVVVAEPKTSFDERTQQVKPYEIEEE